MPSVTSFYCAIRDPPAHMSLTYIQETNCVLRSNLQSSRAGGHEIESGGEKNRGSIQAFILPANRIHRPHSLLAVVLLDPGRDVERPGVGEEEGAGKEKGVRLHGEGDHLHRGSQDMSDTNAWIFFKSECTGQQTGV